jgi:hypothetical protein
MYVRRIYGSQARCRTNVYVCSPGIGVTAVVCQVQSIYIRVLGCIRWCSSGSEYISRASRPRRVRLRVYIARDHLHPRETCVSARSPPTPARSRALQALQLAYPRDVWRCRPAARASARNRGNYSGRATSDVVRRLPRRREAGQKYMSELSGRGLQCGKSLRLEIFL